MWNLLFVICSTAGTLGLFIPIYTYNQGAFNLQPRPSSRSILVVLNLLILANFIGLHYFEAVFCGETTGQNFFGPTTTTLNRFILKLLILVQGSFPATCILLGVLNVHLTSWGVNEALHFTFEKAGTDQGRQSLSFTNVRHCPYIVRAFRTIKMTFWWP